MPKAPSPKKSPAKPRAKKKAEELPLEGVPENEAVEARETPEVKRVEAEARGNHAEERADGPRGESTYAGGCDE